MYDMSQHISQRHSSTQHLVDLLTPNPNLPDDLFAVSSFAQDYCNEMLGRLGDGPEMSTGLRKLLEAKDCFVRQALLDQQVLLDQ